MKIYRYLLVYLCPQFLWGSYEASYDINMSPYAGGENLLLATEIVEQGNLYIGKHLPLDNPLGVVWRASELCALYLPLNFFTSVVQHEVFGHGYRIRDINHDLVSVLGYHFSWPPPYGNGSASTSFSFKPREITTTQLSCIAMAGFEAQSILAMQTRWKWMESAKVDPKQAALYLVSLYAVSLYQKVDALHADSISGHDLVEYTTFLNHTYTEGFLSVGAIQSLSWINLIDPFTYYAVFAWGRYLFWGKETPLPMIPIGNYGYLFNIQMGLSPFGVEYFSYHYLVKKERPYSFYLKGGVHAQNTYFGLGCFAPSLWKWNHFSLGFRFDAWRQPELLLFKGEVPLIYVDFRAPPEEIEPIYSEEKQHSQQYGVAASAIASYKVSSFFGLQGELGYKTSGFLPGYSLYASPVVRVAGNFCF